jgi:hypothetical protein
MQTTIMLDSVFKEIDDYVQETGEKMFSISTIAKKGWLAGAKYVYILNLVNKGDLAATKLVSSKNKNRFSYRIFYEDLKNYLEKIHNGSV